MRVDRRLRLARAPALAVRLAAEPVGPVGHVAQQAQDRRQYAQNGTFRWNGGPAAGVNVLADAVNLKSGSRAWDLWRRQVTF